jgi:hypothetical protein
MREKVDTSDLRFPLRKKMNKETYEDSDGVLVTLLDRFLGVHDVI